MEHAMPEPGSIKMDMTHEPGIKKEKRVAASTARSPAISSYDSTQYIMYIAPRYSLSITCSDRICCQL
jgi:hypothetical protein